MMRGMSMSDRLFPFFRSGTAALWLLAVGAPLTAHAGAGEALLAADVPHASPLPAAAAPALATVSHPVDLRQALEAAWQRHPQTAALAARQTEAQARSELADSLTPSPASVAIGQKTDRLHGNEGQREWEVEVATPLWLPAQKAARQGEAQKGAQLLQAQTRLLRWQLAGELREAWWALAAARSSQAVARQRLATAEALAQSVQRRYAQGDLARVDANLAQGEQLAAQIALLEAEQALQQAEQRLVLLTGRPAPAELPAEPMPPFPLSPPSPPSHPETQDLAAHPQLEALRAGSELAASRVALVDASRRDAPELALRWISERRQATLPEERSVGIKLTWPLSSSARVQQDSAAARAELSQADAELAQARLRIEQDVAQARQALAAAERQLSLARERQALAADNLTLAQRSFDLGESDLPMLMRARSEAIDAEAKLRQQQVARELAVSRLHQSLGLLP